MKMKNFQSSQEVKATEASEVLAVLEPEQLSQARHRLPRRKLKRSEVFLLWSLRVYLLFMLAVILYQVWLGR